MFFDRFECRIGSVIVVGDKNGLTQLCIDNGSKDFSIPSDWQHNPDNFNDVRRQLNEYLSGIRCQFDLKISPQGTEFQKRVWQALTTVPYAQTESYKAVAEKIGDGKASRAVGMANNKNPLPIIIPCHRVIGSNRKLTGYAFGLDIKTKLIDLELINTVFRRLAGHFGEFTWWYSDNPYEVMVGAILTQNTNWKNVEKALNNLNGQLCPKKILAMSESSLAELIRPSGYYNQKAIKLRAMTKWYQHYQFDIENVRSQDKQKLRNELMAIKGIGGETADSILVYAIGKSSFVIDAYTRRIFSRVGLNVPKDYDEFRAKIEDAITDDCAKYAYFHGLMVEHAKAFCLKSKAKCLVCPMQEFCQSSTLHTI
ncbi:methylated-DNA--[protein]-cysteine S-methyltransferase [Vibrio sp. VB16]|uniref:methylated-DNA--[protein]-cysteine S-methyltransferase n=1 Tax=Vibrio sp. VB16 TaxID=2785746 RepID=UPI00189CC7C9|nr:methylated-DNA--[protein]-cysteine S-methyltransferase [Vibrio sp. VB16]UGA55720.1 methylated-DNA--[protein]-cysteine S-methyltransferase [Vibrio sp. VB16]